MYEQTGLDADQAQDGILTRTEGRSTMASTSADCKHDCQNPGDVDG